METITVRLDEKLSRDLAVALAGGKGKSAYVRDAIQEKLEHEAGVETEEVPTWMERTIVYMLLEVLRNLKSQKLLSPDDLNALQEAAANGYRHDFKHLNPIRPESFPEDVISEVRDILFMHRVLANSVRDYKSSAEVTGEDVRFRGFDGNEETEHFSYADYVFETLNEFQESASCDGGCENTHQPILDRYRAMLHAWKQCKTTYHPTKTEFAAILKAGSNN